MLSISAFNALLKTLEEPPKHVIFILATTELDRVPETIISRCQCYDFKRISVADIVLCLKNICANEGFNVDDEVFELIISIILWVVEDKHSAIKEIPPNVRDINVNVFLFKL